MEENTMPKTNPLKEKIIDVLKTNNQNPDESRYGADTLMFFQDDENTGVEDVSNDLLNLIEENYKYKVNLLALFFSKERIIGEVLLDKLLELDDLWKREYEKNRIHSFAFAQLKANEAIINSVLAS